MVVDYRFDANARPLRTHVTGKSSFFPITVDSAETNFKPLTCSKGHMYRGGNYPWYTCSHCRPGALGCAYICIMCYKFCCQKCYDGHKNAQIAERQNPKGKSTFLRLPSGSSFTLQIPTSSVAASDDFTATVEVRLEQLPAALDHVAALLRLGDDPNSHQGRARRRVKASVYLGADGVPGSDEFLAGHREAGGAEAGEVKNEALGTIAFKPGKVWQVVTVVNKLATRTREIYLDGDLATTETGLSMKDTAFPQFLTMFGGGKQSESRGGAIRRFMLHNRAMTSDEVRALVVQLRHENPLLFKAAISIQALARGRLLREQRKVAQEALEAGEDQDQGGTEEPAAGAEEEEPPSGEGEDPEDAQAQDGQGEQDEQDEQSTIVDPVSQSFKRGILGVLAKAKTPETA